MPAGIRGRGFMHHTIQAALGEIARLARTGGYADAASRLNTVLQSIQTGLTTSPAARDPRGISDIPRSLGTLYELQKRSDWVAFADVLEYEFVPLWTRVMGGGSRESGARSPVFVPQGGTTPRQAEVRIMKEKNQKKCRGGSVTRPDPCAPSGG